MTRRGERGLRWLFAAPLLVWFVAGAVNSTTFIMGSPPTGLGTAATFLAVCVWPAAGWFAGARASAAFLRFAAACWIVVTAGVPFVFWVLNESVGMSATQGGLVLPLLLFALMAPLYGLYGLLPAWEPIAQVATIGLVALGMTMVAYVCGRRVHKD